MTRSRDNATNVAGDISGVTAGTGLSGGGTNGSVTLDLSTPVASTNGGTGLSSFTTGDMIYSSSGNTLAKLGIGTTSQVLTVASGLPSWATVSSGSMTLLSTTTLSGASTTISGISGSYQDLLIQVSGFSFTNGTGYIGFEPNSTDATGTVNFVFNSAAAAAYSDYIQTLTASKYFLTSTKHNTTNGNTNNQIYMYIRNYTSATKKIVTSSGYAHFATINDALFTMHGFIDLGSAISSLKLTPLVPGGTTFDAGTVKIYGVN